jgi:large subunit ribosomal protein L25
MSTVSLDVFVRNERGKGPARRLRAQGMAPAVFYGEKASPIALAVNEREFRKAVEKGGSNALFDLQIKSNGETTNRMAILKDRHIRPVDAAIIHLDFYEIFMDVEIQVSIPIELTGKPVGVEDGGMLQSNTRELYISCLPRAVPDNVVVDVSHLSIGDTLHVTDLDIPEGVTVLTDESISVATVLSPRVEEEEPEEGEEAEGEEGEGEEGGEEAEEGEESE